MGTITLLLPLLISILKEAPQLAVSVQKIWKLVTAKHAPTEAEHAAFMTALEEAHKKLQES